MNLFLQLGILAQNLKGRSKVEAIFLNLRFYFSLLTSKVMEIDCFMWQHSRIHSLVSWVLKSSCGMINDDK